MATDEEIRRVNFIQQMAPFAQRWGAESGIDPAVLLAIMGSESNFGNAPSLFGIKGSGTGGTSNLATHEVYGGQNVNLNDNFAVNNTADDAFHQFLDLISTTPRYADAWQKFQQTGDSAGLLAGINKAGYATDPNWHSTVTSIAASQVQPVLAKIPAPAAAAAPAPAAPVSPLPAPAPQGTPPMAAPTSGQTDLQKALLEGRTVETNGIWSTYIPLNGQDTHIFFYSDGTAEVDKGYGTPEGLAQNGALKADYTAHGPPNPGDIPVTQGHSQAGTPTITLSSNAVTQAPAASTATGTASATAGNNSSAQASNTITGGGPTATGTAPANVAGGTNVPSNSARATGDANATAGSSSGEKSATATTPKDVIPGTNVPAPKTPQEVAQAEQQRIASTPRPTGFINPVAIPGQTGNAQADTTGNFLHSLNQTDQQTGKSLGTPYYSSNDPATANAIRQAGYPMLAAQSPGFTSIVSPAGGIGYNPLAPEDAQRGLAAFNIPPPGSQISQSQYQALQTNPYSAENPLEQARLSGGLVKPIQFEQGGTGPGGSQPVTVQYRRGGFIRTPPIQQSDSTDSMPPSDSMGNPRMFSTGGQVQVTGNAGQMLAGGGSVDVPPQFDLDTGPASLYNWAPQGITNQPIGQLPGQLPYLERPYLDMANLPNAYIDQRDLLPILNRPYLADEYSPQYKGGGSLTIPEPSRIIGQSGKTYATISEVRPEAIAPHPGGFSVVNHVAGTERYAPPGANRVPGAAHADFGDFFQNTASPTPSGSTSSTSAAPTPSPSYAGASGFGGEPVPTVSQPATPQPSTDTGSTTGATTASSLPVSGGLTSTPSSDTSSSNSIASALGVTTPNTSVGTPPNPYSYSLPSDYLGSINNSAGGPSNAVLDNPAYQTALANYNKSLDTQDANLQTQAASAEQRLLDALGSPQSEQTKLADAALQRARQSTDYQYGLAGMQKPVEVQPPYAFPGTPMPSSSGLPPGTRYAIVTPQDQYQTLLNFAQNYFNAARNQISAAKALAAINSPPSASLSSSLAAGAAKGFTGVQPVMIVNGHGQAVA